MEVVTDFIFFGSKITAHSNCSHETQRHLLFRRKAMTDLAAAAKSLQSCPTLWDSIDGSPPGSPVPGIPQVFDQKPFNYIGITDQFLYHLQSLSTCLKVVNCNMALKSLYIIRQPPSTHHLITSSIHRRSSQ